MLIKKNTPLVSRNSRCHRHPLIAALLFSCIAYSLANPATADTPYSPDSKPNQDITTKRDLQQKIKNLQKEIADSSQEKDHIELQLKTADQTLNRLLQKIREQQKALNKQTRELNQLTQQKQRARKQLKAHQQSLKNEIMAAYSVGKQEYLKLLLNQESPYTISRALAYYRFYSEARAKRISNIEDNLASLTQLEIGIKKQTKIISETKQALTLQQDSLKNEQQNRSLILTKINTEMADKRKILAKLIEDEKNLQRLVNGLNNRLPKTAPNNAPFSKLKGQLAWPTQGTIHNNFGLNRGESRLKWQGVTISAQSGSSVQAVSQGRIVFSDWLRGFGLLIIIDHGRGFMSLYGHNQNLRHEIGDWVNAGDVISEIGPGNGQKTDGLYFEIRKNGIPQNPTHWCKASPN